MAALVVEQLPRTKAATGADVQLDKLDVRNVELVVGEMRHEVEVLPRILEHVKDSLKVERVELAQVDLSSPPACQRREEITLSI